MTNTNNTVKVAVLPDCDFCNREGVKRVARYDAATTLGPWANMCQQHFDQYAYGLGTGRGQKLVLDVPPPKQKPVSGGSIR